MLGWPAWASLWGAGICAQTASKGLPGIAVQKQMAIPIGFLPLYFHPEGPAQKHMCPGQSPCTAKAPEPAVSCHVASLLLQVVARSKDDILKAKGVKPTLSPNLNTLAIVEALDVKRLLFIGVGCQVIDVHQREVIILNITAGVMVRTCITARHHHMPTLLPSALCLLLTKVAS